MWNTRWYGEILDGLELAYECAEDKETISKIMDAVRECENEGCWKTAEKRQNDGHAG